MEMEFLPAITLRDAMNATVDELTLDVAKAGAVVHSFVIIVATDQGLFAAEATEMTHDTDGSHS